MSVKEPIFLGVCLPRKDRKDAHFHLQNPNYTLCNVVKNLGSEPVPLHIKLSVFKYFHETTECGNQSLVLVPSLGLFSFC